jgi:hypothetical protein
MSVILEVPVPVSALGVRPRCRTPQHLTVAYHIPVDVRELSGPEAPVIMRAELESGRCIEYRRKPGDDLSGSFWSNGNGYRERKLDAANGMLRPILPDGWDQPVTPSTIGAYFEELLAGEGNHQSRDWHLLPTSRKIYLSHRREGDFRTFEYENLDRDLAPYKDFWARAAFIDDVLHVPSGGPVWEAHFRPVSIRPSTSRIVDMEGYLRLVEEVGFLEDRAICFPPTEFLEAKSALARKASRWIHDHSWSPPSDKMSVWNGKIGEPIGTFTDLSAPRSQVFPRDAAVAAIKWLVDNIETSIGKSSTATIRRFADLRDAIDATDMTNDVAVESLLAAAVSFKDASSADLKMLREMLPEADPFTPVLEMVARSHKEPGPDPERTLGLAY